MRASPLLLLVLAVLAPTVQAAPAKTPPVVVTRLTYHGWPGAVRLSNGLVEAVVVPVIGRIMAFQLAGHPETNPLFENPEWIGKTLAGVDPATWANFGGDKLWPSPQSDWGKHAVRAWPPDQAFDGAPQTAQILPNGVRLTTPPSAAFAARATRTITLEPGQARLYLAQTLDKDPEASGDRDGFLIGIWTVSQVRGDASVFLPLSPPGKFPGGFLSLSSPGTTEAAPFFTSGAGVLGITRDPQTAHKVGVSAPAAWIAALYAGTVLFSEQQTTQPGVSYPDGGLPVEAYTNAGATAYSEMELLGPLVPLTHARRLTHTLVWHLERLPRAPKDAADARALVAAALRPVTQKRPAPP